MKSFSRFLLPIFGVYFFAPSTVFAQNNPSSGVRPLSAAQLKELIPSIALELSSDKKSVLLIGTYPTSCGKDGISLTPGTGRGSTSAIKGWSVNVSERFRTCLQEAKDKNFACSSDSDCISLSSLQNSRLLLSGDDSFEVGIVWVDHSADVSSALRIKGEALSPSVKHRGDAIVAKELLDKKVSELRKKYDDAIACTSLAGKSEAFKYGAELIELGVLTPEELAKATSSFDENYRAEIEREAIDGDLENYFEIAMKLIEYVDGNESLGIKPHPDYNDEAIDMIKAMSERLVEDAEDDSDFTRATRLLDLATSRPGLSRDQSKDLEIAQATIKLKHASHRASEGRITKADAKKLEREARRLLKKNGCLSRRRSKSFDMNSCSFAMYLGQQAQALHMQALQPRQRDVASQRRHTWQDYFSMGTAGYRTNDLGSSFPMQSSPTFSNPGFMTPGYRIDTNRWNNSVPANGFIPQPGNPSIPGAPLS